MMCLFLLGSSATTLFAYVDDVEIPSFLGPSLTESLFNSVSALELFFKAISKPLKL